MISTHPLIQMALIALVSGFYQVPFDEVDHLNQCRA